MSDATATSSQDAPYSSLQRSAVTLCVMLATIMTALDMTICNVALPYMQGALSTTQDQINWVLTSYIVAAAILTAPLGWLTTRLGRKRLFIICTVGFTVASMLCGMAQNIDEMVFFRLLQGMFGAGLVPLSQSILLDIYPPAQRGQAMAMWGMGVILGPIVGPTLGGELTEHYSWRWVFYVNVPFGILTAVGAWLFMRETPIRRGEPFDWFGFLSLSLGIGALQLMLDRGQDLGWFDSSEIVTEAILSAAGFYFFIADSVTAEHPFISLGIFRDWNFSVALVFAFIVGCVLLSTMAVVTPFLQGMLNYPVITAGNLLGTRGIGTFFSMMIVGRLIGKVSARGLIFFGLSLATVSLWLMSRWNLDVSARTIVLNGMLQGVGFGFVFVPLNTIAFASLPAHLRTEGAALWTLVRNIGSSVGIALVMAQLTRLSTIFHAELAEHVTPFNDALRLPNAVAIAAPTQGNLATLNAMVTQQGYMMAYVNDFLLMMFVTMAAFPLLALIRVAPNATADAGAIAAD